MWKRNSENNSESTPNEEKNKKESEQVSKVVEAVFFAKKITIPTHNKDQTVNIFSGYLNFFKSFGSNEDDLCSFLK